MHSRRFTRISISVLPILLTATALQAGPEATLKSTTQPAVSADRPSANENLGSVQRALIRLREIPLEQWADTAQSPNGESAVRSKSGLGGSVLRNEDGSVRTEPIHPGSEPHRLGLQHSDAIRHSVSSVPLGDDINGAQARPRYVPVEPAGAGPDYYSADYYRPTRRLSSSRRDWVDYRYYNGRPSAYGRGRYTREYGYNDAAGEHFRFGFLEGYDRGRWEAQADRRTRHLVETAHNHLSRGLTYFRNGRYHQAAKSFRLSATTNQGDPAARLYAAHSLFAIGRYRDGVEHLRRAFDLQPEIAFLHFDIRDDYGNKKEFGKQLKALERALHQSPHDMDRLLMAGYIYTFSGEQEKGYKALIKVKRLDRRERLADQILQGNQPPDVVVDQLR